MRTAIISDIHANPHALERVLADAASQGVDKIVCLGDIVGYGYDPSSCISMLRAKNIECVKGNHDAGVGGELSLGWFSARAQSGIFRHSRILSEEDKNWLRALPYQIRTSLNSVRYCFSHGTFSRPEEFNYIEERWQANSEMGLMEAEMPWCALLFVGHTHYAQTYAQRADGTIEMFTIDNSPDLTIKLGSFTRCIINVGSVGYPRNQPYSIYCIYDDETAELHYRQLPFDYEHYIYELSDRDIDVPLWVMEDFKKQTKEKGK